MLDSAGDYRVTRWGPKHLDRLEQVWRMLDSGQEMSAFQRYEWMALSNERAAAERASRLLVRTRYYLVERAGEPLLIAPLRVHLAALSPGHRRGVYLTGRNGPADYLNFIYIDFDPRAAVKALNAIVSDCGLRSIRLERLLAGTQAHQWASALPGASVKGHTAVRLEVPASDTDYNALLTKSTRQNIRTAWNRARTDGVELKVSVTSHLSPADADELAQLKSRREASRRIRESSRRDRLVAGVRSAYFASLFTPFDEARQAMTRTDRPWVLRVHADGEVCAFAFGLGDLFGGRRTLRLLQVGIDERFARYSPGLIGLHHFISSEAEAGRPNWDVVDFTRGEEPYKAQLGGTGHRYDDVGFRWSPDQS